MLITALVAYAVLEFLWLWFMSSFYSKQLGFSKVQSVPAAVLAYALLVPALVYFVLWPASASASASAKSSRDNKVKAVLRGAFFGAAIYGVYNLTNKATLKGYSWTMVGVDTLWGTGIFAAVAAIATFAKLP